MFCVWNAKSPLSYEVITWLLNGISSRGRSFTVNLISALCLAFLCFSFLSFCSLNLFERQRGNEQENFHPLVQLPNCLQCLELGWGWSQDLGTQSMSCHMGVRKPHLSHCWCHYHETGIRSYSQAWNSDTLLWYISIISSIYMSGQTLAPMFSCVSINPIRLCWADWYSS